MEKSDMGLHNTGADVTLFDIARAPGLTIRVVERGGLIIENAPPGLLIGAGGKAGITIDAKGVAVNEPMDAWLSSRGWQPR